MNRPIPSCDYVNHSDPELERHRAWLQAALERLVDHEPEALVKGGPLWRLWSTETAPIATPPPAEATIVASASRHSNPLEGVPRFQQRDCAQLSQRDGTCFSSSCAMLLEALKPGTLPGANGDDAYLAVVQSADFDLIEEQIARGIPVPCGYIHRGPVDRPTGSGHWLLVYGHTPTHLVVNDPWGEPDLVSGATLNANGMGLCFSRQNFGKRWMV
jgi:hypothetical protein